MILFVALIIVGWCFYRLAWKLDKNTLLYTLSAIGAYLVLLLLTIYVFAVLFSFETGIPVNESFLIEIEIFFMHFYLLQILIFLLPPAILLFTAYKIIEYRAKGASKINRGSDLLDNSTNE